MSEPQWLTAAEVAAELRLSKPTVYRLAETGELPAVKIGRSVRIRADALKAYLVRTQAPARKAA